MSTALRWGAATDVGRLRSVNEDSLVAAVPLFAVADGMGGHAGGEVASRVALETLQQRFVGTAERTTDGLVRAIQDANAAVYERSLGTASLRGMGTTLTAVALVERDGHERLAVVNVGDSRTYVVQDGILLQITRDHTYVEDLVAAGEITPDEARVHPQRHIITRALGIEHDVQVDAWEATPGAGDRYLICSDGLFNEVDDGQIGAVLTGTVDPQDAADELVALANDAGGRDNVSVVIVDVTGAPSDADITADRDASGSAATRTHDAADDALSATTSGVALDEPTESRATQKTRLVETPVGLASPDGSPPVVNWVEAESPPTERTPVPPPTSPAEPEPSPATRPKRITWRVIVFVLAIVAIIAVALGGITYYGRSGYYVGFAGDQVAVFKGQQGGVLWVKPTVEATYPLHRGDLSPAWQQNLDRTISFTSRSAADDWFDTLAANPAAVPALTSTAATTAAATTPAPPPTDSTPAPSGP
jgi:protein phosphatase